MADTDNRLLDLLTYLYTQRIPTIFEKDIYLISH